MRNNFISFFHKAIITSLCCVILVSCGYKTAPVYVPDSVDSNQSESNTTIKDKNAKV